MIVSHKHKFVFVAIPKTGTHSIRQALRPHLGPHDWEQCGLFEKKQFPMQSIAQLGHGHITCLQLREVLPSPFFEDYFKFCFVRDPYERFLSLCYFLNRDNQRMQTDPVATMHEMISNPKLMQHILARPQTDFISDESGDLLVDFVGRVEHMQSDFDEISNKTSTPHAKLPRSNISPNKERDRPRFGHENHISEFSAYCDEMYRADLGFSHPTVK